MKNNRTFLEKLLDGAEVEWKSLGKVTDIKTGQSVSKNIIAQNPGIYPVINSGRDPLGFINEWNTENDPIGITTRGAGVGSITWQEGKYFRGNLNYSVTIKSDYELNVRFLYHVLLHFQKEIHNLCSFTGIPALNASELKKLEIPIPPLSVQTEIVRILDALTALTSELTSELILRQKQYEYYREKLLSFDSLEQLNSGGGKKKLIDVAKIKNGKDWKHLGEGNIPIYGSGGIMGYVDTYSYDKPTVLIPRKGTITNIFYLEEPFWNVDTIYYTEIDTTQILPKYFYHFMKTVDLTKLDTGSGRPSLTQAILNEIPIFVPSIEEQHRIVSILDKFEALTNSITEGLPLAIEQSQKRYEYYRELLLNFPGRE
ncbi:type I restriction/modification specificity protein [Haemophilus parahaemolyticus HK385]|uniref:restriction endonuclease subunit S n=1 Tax=Haemophilus parahaemolyticus TaxID=735 RepID=UPI000993CEC5|nr:restriction endonuclease subunit S [Haemophilus parahaemolyticus]OOR94988.1 restriction endonuclease subunit S [Haemophilus parahaemolyticus]QRP12267.1 restriction endonuclease subunit S [Haemophilus parahaemolyticus]STO66957.1 type I restriction/modification specificity protein [Haemophilus parahaemolyticus HK385]